MRKKYIHNTEHVDWKFQYGSITKGIDMYKCFEYHNFFILTPNDNNLGLKYVTFINTSIVFITQNSLSTS